MHWLSFIFISLLIIIVPGPDFFIVVKNTLNGSSKNGILSALGISTAHLIYAVMSAIGLIVILTSSYYIFFTIKVLGAIYIAYLGIKSIVNARKHQNFMTNEKRQAKSVAFFTSFKQGFLSTMLNPKAILFYISILPQFITSDAQASQQIIVLCSLFIITVFIWFALCSLIFNLIKTLFNNSKFKTIFDYLVGAVLIALSISILKVEN